MMAQTTVSDSSPSRSGVFSEGTSNPRLTHFPLTWESAPPASAMTSPVDSHRRASVSWQDRPSARMLL